MCTAEMNTYVCINMNSMHVYMSMCMYVYTCIYVCIYEYVYLY